MPIFTHPWAFTALAALPALAAIYWLRNRYRRQPVSSLMLWVNQREAREGGSRLDRLQTPLLFWLELLALLLVIVAAAGPALSTTFGARPLLVVLDDSYSMLAGGDQCPRAKALEALDKGLRQGSHYSVRFILAGDAVGAMGDPVRTAREAALLLKDWRCHAPTARLDEAMSLAAEIGGERADILVVTDHEPAGALDKGRLKWRSFGLAHANLAFINAVRSARDGPERLFLEIANLSSQPQVTNLILETGEPAAELRDMPLQMASGETRRIVLDLKEGVPLLRARIGADALAIDNQVQLFPSVHKQARVEVRIKDATLRPLVDKAVRAIRGAQVTTLRPEIIFTDQDADDIPEGQVWQVEVLAEKDGSAYSGPFIVDRSHPLTEGLSLQGTIWGGGKTEDFPGAPVVMAGGIPLLTDAEGVNNRHKIRLRLRPDLSTLQDSPNWPILWWNLIQWHGTLAPGLSRPNVRLGDVNALTLASTQDQAEVTAPDGTTKTMSFQEKRLVVKAEDVGVHEIKVNEDKHLFAANALYRDESDLSQCVTGQWGEWAEDPAQHLGLQDYAWILLLLALGILSLHLYLVGRGKGN